MKQNILEKAASKPYTILIWFFIFHVFCWTLGTDFSHLVLKYDMTENYVWGREIELGYYKHPPLFAWVSYLWLTAIGVNHASYFLLSQLNVIIGMVFIFLLARKFIGQQKAVFAVILLELVICYNFKSLRFNANTILIPLFPACAFFFVQALDNNKTKNWTWFGITAALAMLSKYASICLLLTFIVYALHKRRDAFTNPRAYIGIAAFLLLMLPHIYWIFHTDFMIFDYISDKKSHKHFFGYYGILFPFSQIAFFVLALVVIFFTTKKNDTGIGKVKSDVDEKSGNNNDTLLLYLTFLPTLFMAMFGFGMNMRIIESWGIPNWFLITTFALKNRSIFRPKSIIAISYAVCFVYLIYGVVVNIFHIKTKWTECNSRQIHFEIEEIWNYTTNNRKLRYAVGNINPIQDFIFYSKSKPHPLFEFNHKISPWIPHKSINGGEIIGTEDRKSAIVMCEAVNSKCVQKAKEYFFGIDFVTLEKNNMLIYIPQ